MADKIDRADKMADVNSKMSASGEIVFTGDEIREAVGMEPLSEDEKYRDDTGDLSDLEQDRAQDPGEDLPN